MTKILRRNVSARGVRELLSKVRHAIDPDMSRKLMGTVYNLEDGGALLVDEASGRGVHYLNRDELDKVYEQARIRALRHSNGPFLLPQGEGFPLKVPELVQDLRARLGLDQHILDGSLTSLSALDNTLPRWMRHHDLPPDLLPPLVAYIGEIVRTATGGKQRPNQFAFRTNLVRMTLTHNRSYRHA